MEKIVKTCFLSFAFSVSWDVNLEKGTRYNSLIERWRKKFDTRWMKKKINWSIQTKKT